MLRLLQHDSGQKPRFNKIKNAFIGGYGKTKRLAVHMRSASSEMNGGGLFSHTDDW